MSNCTQTAPARQHLGTDTPSERRPRTRDNSLLDDAIMVLSSLMREYMAEVAHLHEETCWCQFCRSAEKFVYRIDSFLSIFGGEMLTQAYGDWPVSKVIDQVLTQHLGDDVARKASAISEVLFEVCDLFADEHQCGDDCYRTTFGWCTRCYDVTVGCQETVADCFEMPDGYVDPRVTNQVRMILQRDFRPDAATRESLRDHMFERWRTTGSRYV